LPTFKKIIFWVFCTACIFLAGWAYLSLKQVKKPGLNILTLFPDNCLVYFNTTNIRQLNSQLNTQNLIFRNWKKNEDVLRFSQSLSYFDSLIYANENLNSLVTNNKLHVALYSHKGVYSWLGAIQLKEAREEKLFHAFLTNTYQKEADEIFVMPNKQFVSLYKGALMISNNKKLLNQIHTSSLFTNKDFISGFNKTDDNIPANVFIHSTEINRYPNALPLNLSSLVYQNNSWLSFKTGPSEFSLSGYAKQNSATALKNTSEWPYNYMPFNTRYFKTLSFANAEKYFLTAVIDSAALANFSKEWAIWNQKAMYPLQKQFFENMLRCGEFYWDENSAIIVQVDDTLQTKELLSLICEKDSVVGQQIHLLKKNLKLTNLLANQFNTSCRNAFMINNYLFLTTGNKESTSLYESIVNGSVLSKNSEFMEYASNNMLSEAGMINYCNPSLCPELVNSFLHYPENTNKRFTENLVHSSFSMLANLTPLFRMHVQYRSPESQNMPNLLWQSSLLDFPHTRVYPFLNHNTGDKELILQDKSNHLYLIGPAGNILWKKKIKELAESDLYTVDVFKNKKKQIFFQTENYLHLIDRNGNYLNGYPVKLPAKATNKASLIDYDDDGDIRIFIACENNQIYNYTLYGIMAEGYRPYKTEEPVRLPVKFARVGASDYLITADENGSVHAFSRKGDARIGFRNKMVQNCTDIHVLSTNTIYNTFLYYVDGKNSLVSKISFADKKDVITINLEPDDYSVYFSYVNADQTPDILLTAANGLFVYDVNGVLLFQNKEMNGELAVFFDPLKGGSIISSYHAQKSQAVIAETYGSSVQKMPASSLPVIIDLFGDGKKYLVYTQEQKLICRLLK